jgi:mannitol 2-dehydrogenase
VGRAAERSVIGSMTEYLFAPDDPDAVVERMTDPHVRIVSLTVTEGGDNLDALTGEFDVTAPPVQADLRGDLPPKTMYALVTAALRRRRDRGITPFSVVSCDNVDHNGDVARTCICGYAAAADPALATWIEDSVLFPNSMVDRITLATTDTDRPSPSSGTGTATNGRSSVSRSPSGCCRTWCR